MVIQEIHSVSRLRRITLPTFRSRASPGMHGGNAVDPDQYRLRESASCLAAPYGNEHDDETEDESEILPKKQPADSQEISISGTLKTPWLTMPGGRGELPTKGL